MSSDVTAEQRQRMIAEAAYFRAQRRGFQGGNPIEDWLAAEAEVQRALALSVRPPITQQELDRLMARAREAQMELRAEELRMKLQAQAMDGRPSAMEQPFRSDYSAVAWEALSQAVKSICADKE